MASRVSFYILVNKQPVNIIVHYTLGDTISNISRGYYYKINPMKFQNNNLIFYYLPEYEVESTLIEEANRFNSTHFKQIKNIAVGKYYDYLRKEQNIKLEHKDFEVINDIDELKLILKKLEENDSIKEEEHDFSIDKNNNNYDLSLGRVILNTDTKNSITQVIHFIKNKKAYDKIGAKMPKGILLYGPPGTGKTTIARTIAKETNSSFFNVTGSEFVEKYVGVGAKRVRTLFEKARKASPSIIFIDEIDAIGSKRDSEMNKEKDQTLNQLLVELDGFNTLDNVIVIAATNRLDLLDGALIRSGRFDRKLFIDLPNEENRYKLFELFLKNIITDSNIDYNLLSMITENYSGADIANICNESAIQAVNENRKYVIQSDLEYMIEKNQNHNNIEKRNIGFI